ncbi:MAG: chemotaxis protein CheX [Magnetococcus sp. DMHC-6]
MILDLEHVVDDVLRKTISSFFLKKIQYRSLLNPDKTNFFASTPGFAESTISAIITFTGRTFSGGVTITALTSTALKIASAFSGCPIGTMMFFTKESKDAFGELVNIISGAIKISIETQISEQLHSSSPFIVSGQNMNVWVGSHFMTRKFYYQSEVGNFMIELVVGAEIKQV